MENVFSEQMNEIPVEVRKRIIKLAVLIMSSGLRPKDKIIRTLARNEREEQFASQVYDIIMAYKEEVKATRQEEWQKEMTTILEQELNLQKLPDYKFGMYKPEKIVAKKQNGEEVPEVQLYRFHLFDRIEENYAITTETKNVNCTIRKIGQLVYARDKIGAKEALEEYEILIQRDGEKQKEFRKFGNISFFQMTDIMANGKQMLSQYGKEVLLDLLGENNLEDPEWYDYIGELVEREDADIRMIMQNKIVHDATEYTAVVMWKQLERQGKRPISLDKRNRSDKVSGIKTPSIEMEL